MTELLKYEMSAGGRVLVNGKPAVGHPVHLTDEAIDEVVAMIENGNYLGVAFTAAGFNPASLVKWRTQAEKVADMYPDLDARDLPDNVIPANVTPAEWQAFKLLSRMRYAEARSEAFAVLSVRKHFPDQWTAAMTYLERRFPERWRKRQTIESVDGGTVITDDEALLISDPVALELLHDALERVAASPDATAALTAAPSALPDGGGVVADGGGVVADGGGVVADGGREATT